MFLVFFVVFFQIYSGKKIGMYWSGIFSVQIKPVSVIYALQSPKVLLPLQGKPDIVPSRYVEFLPSV